MFIKLSLKLGAILGAILGVGLLIPFINSFSCFILYTIVGAGIVYYLKKNSLIGVLSLQDGALIGAVAGFSSLIAAAVIYLPCSYILNIIYSPLAKPLTKMFSSFVDSIFVVLMLVSFMAMLSALFNAFSGLIVAYIYERLEQYRPTEEEETDFIIE